MHSWIQNFLLLLNITLVCYHSILIFDGIKSTHGEKWGGGCYLFVTCLEYNHCYFVWENTNLFCLKNIKQLSSVCESVFLTNNEANEPDIFITMSMLFSCRIVIVSPKRCVMRLTWPGYFRINFKDGWRHLLNQGILFEGAMARLIISSRVGHWGLKLGEIKLF